MENLYSILATAMKFNNFLAVVFLIIGIYLLFKASDTLVNGSVALARHFGISQMVVGLTVVAMGTSAPEVAASVVSAIKSHGSIAIGNVYGSNVANLLLIGGVSAIIAPILVQSITIKRELPIMIGSTLILWPLLHNLVLSRLEGVILIILFVAFLVLTVFCALKSATKAKLQKSAHEIEQSIESPMALRRAIFFIIIGLIGVALGAKLTVDGGVFIGRKIGIPEAVIGMSIIAIGTSLPELVTSVVAAMKGHSDLSIGNLVGSNIFNALLVLGCASITKPCIVEPRLIGIDFVLVLSVSVIFAIMISFKLSITRFKGIFFLILYIAYMWLIFSLQSPETLTQIN